MKLDSTGLNKISPYADGSYDVCGCYYVYSSSKDHNPIIGKTIRPCFLDRIRKIVCKIFK